MYEEPEEEHGFHVGPSWEQDCEGRRGTLLVEGIIIARRCGVCPSNMVWYVVQAGRKFHVSQGDRILSWGGGQLLSFQKLCEVLFYIWPRLSSLQVPSLVPSLYSYHHTVRQLDFCEGRRSGGPVSFP